MGIIVSVTDCVAFGGKRCRDSIHAPVSRRKIESHEGVEARIPALARDLPYNGIVNQRNVSAGYRRQTDDEWLLWWWDAAVCTPTHQT